MSTAMGNYLAVILVIQTECSDAQTQPNGSLAAHVTREILAHVTCKKRVVQDVTAHGTDLHHKVAAGSTQQGGGMRPLQPLAANKAACACDSCSTQQGGGTDNCFIASVGCARSL